MFIGALSFNNNDFSKTEVKKQEFKMSLFLQKQNLRKIYLQKRALLNKDDRQQFETIISQKLIKLIQRHTEWKNIACYWAIESEVNLKIFIHYCWDHDISVFLPFIHEDALHFSSFLAKSTLVKNEKYNIFEANSNKVDRTSLLDVVLVPLLAYDGKNNRLGRGGGFYDRWCSHNKHLTKIGVAFRLQKFENELPNNINDVALDFIMTE